MFRWYLGESSKASFSALEDLGKTYIAWLRIFAAWQVSYDPCVGRSYDEDASQEAQSDGSFNTIPTVFAKRITRLSQSLARIVKWRF